MTERESEPMPAIDDDCWFLTGPTASGKTSTALRLAEKIDAEIISLDSMAIYRGMDIGTAKPSQENRQRIVCKPLVLYERGNISNHSNQICTYTYASDD